MVPLNQDDESVDLPKNGATAFFTVPTGPRKKEEPTELKRSDPIAVAGNPSGSIRPPGAQGAPPGMPPGGYVPMGAVPPSPLVPIAPIGISGPVAGGYGPPPSQLPPDPTHDIERARSYRVFAVVAGLMFMVFSVTIVAVLLLASVVLFPDLTGSNKPIATGPTPMPPITGPKDKGAGVDTGIPTAPDLPTDKGKKSVTKPGPVQPVGPRPPPPPPPPPPSASVSVTLGPGSPTFTSIEVKCESAGFQERAPFPSPGTGTATLPKVPGGECRLSFKGGPFVSMPIKAGQSLTCTFNGTTPTCK